ncbi:APC family permease [candidate division KSB1 bacterium]|nr:APC family permease [candidate division KSB1 bacterium]
MNDHHSPPPIDETPASLFKRIRRRLIGGRRNPFDPKVFHSISLIAFFAWVGMGADGISSANYGPEETYHALHGYTFLAPILAAAIGFVVLIISASYVQIIEQFPSGGGGYVVASKLLHPRAGVVSGAALVIDYALTIAVSVVSGVDAIFSLLPSHYAAFRLLTALAAVVLLTYMNLRGVRESVVVLTPIFILFILTHFGLVFYGFVSHLGALPERAAQATLDAHGAAQSVGVFGLILVFLQAFSKGAGTFTGIEAVSNGLLALREPRVHTGKKTMAYMAITLAVLASMILINYFLFNVHGQTGKTLNAVLFQEMMQNWKGSAAVAGHALMWFTLVSAALLLFVAAQTGFIDGPRVLANMALDSWLPHRLSHLSERLVTHNGIVIMGVAATGLLLWAGGNITILVALYAINVFITFTLSQLGMSRLWIQKRREDRRWFVHLLINGFGFVVCATLLVIMIAFKFTSGGWLTLLVTVGLIGLCLYIKNHYEAVKQRVAKIDEILSTLSFGDEPVAKQTLDPHEPTAVILVEKYNGVGIHVLLNVQRLFGPRFKQYVFVSVGAIDAGHFKGVDELAELNAAIKRETDRYVTLARSYGLKADSRVSCEIDYIAEIERVCLEVYEEYPNSVFFAARLLFWKDSVWSRILHNETPLTIQRRLMFHGLQFVVLPVRLQ